MVIKMKINNNLFKADKSGSDKGVMLGAATGGVMGAAAGGAIGLHVGNEVGNKVAENMVYEKLANEQGIKIVDDYAPDVINKKEILEKGGAVWYKKDNVIFTVGDDPRGGGSQYVYTFTPEEFFKNNVNVNDDDYKDLIKNYSIKGMLVGTLTGTFIGALVGAFIGVLVGSDEDKGKKG
jgi:uncharacterized protein YcfJ